MDALFQICYVDILSIVNILEISSLLNFDFNNIEDDFILVLDRIQDPGNMGNLFRTALAAGVNKILLAGGAHPLGQKVLCRELTARELSAFGKRN